MSMLEIKKSCFVLIYYLNDYISTKLLIKIAMDKTNVGKNAGKIWCALKEIGEISIPELARRLNLSVESTALAAGWLARENKICIQRKNGLIALSDENAFPFNFG